MFFDDDDGDFSPKSATGGYAKQTFMSYYTEKVPFFVFSLLYLKQ